MFVIVFLYKIIVNGKLLKDNLPVKAITDNKLPRYLLNL